MSRANGDSLEDARSAVASADGHRCASKGALGQCPNVCTQRRALLATRRVTTATPEGLRCARSGARWPVGRMPLQYPGDGLVANHGSLDGHFKPLERRVDSAWRFQGRSAARLMACGGPLAIHHAPVLDAKKNGPHDARRVGGPRTPLKGGREGGRKRRACGQCRVVTTLPAARPLPDAGACGWQVVDRAVTDAHGPNALAAAHGTRASTSINRQFLRTDPPW